jgi:hypothetical protein
MNKRIIGVIVAVFAVAVLAGAAVAQPEPPPSWVGEPPELITKETQAINLAGMYGTSSKVLASYSVTAKDLDAMGISYPEWSGGEPASMHLVALSGSYQVPMLTKDAPQSMPGELTLMVIDAATGLPTVTIVTAGDEAQALAQRVAAFKR